jgi:uncharacterized membrane protein YvbJ
MPKFCQNCGADLPNPEVKFCNDCGAQKNSASPVENIKPDEIQLEEKSPVVATLCSFLFPDWVRSITEIQKNKVQFFSLTLIGIFLLFTP